MGGKNERIKPCWACRGLAMLLGANAAQAQSNYPNRPIRIIVPYPAGGIVDIVARAVTEQVGRDWKQTVVIEARPAATATSAPPRSRAANRTATPGWSPARRRWSTRRSTRTPAGTR
jgi:tripartite-type tricarboxylate transporter receptor subunit TctC